MHGKMGRLHADLLWGAGRASGWLDRRDVRGRLRGESGQGTVEYVGLMLFVSVLMVGLVAALSKWNGGDAGKELATTVVKKMKVAIDKVSFQ